MTDGASPGEGSICLTFDFDTMAAWMGSFKAVTPGVLSRGEFGGRVGEVAEEFRTRSGGPGGQQP